MMLIEAPFVARDAADELLRHINARRMSALVLASPGAVNAVGSLGMTPLFVACYGLWVAGVGLLLDRGAVAERSSGIGVSSATFLGAMDRLQETNVIVRCTEVLYLLNERCTVIIRPEVEIPADLISAVRDRAYARGYGKLAAALSV